MAGTRIPERLGKWLVSGPPLAYLAVFFAVPTLIMVLASFRTPGEFGGLAPLVGDDGALDLNVESYARFFTDSIYAAIFVKSFWYALTTTLLCLTAAYPLAALIASSPKKYRDLLLLLVILPFWSNFLIRVYAWMIILGPQAALARGVSVTGVIPRHLNDLEIGHKGLTELHVVDSMHQRKALMAELADGFVALPGGVGTLEELFEVYTWGQLGLHPKPVALLDVGGYYASLVGFLDHSVREGFLHAEHRDFLLTGNAPDAVLEAMAGWTPPRVPKWLDRKST